MSETDTMFSYENYLIYFESCILNNIKPLCYAEWLGDYNYKTKSH